jgi:hypothetical protein
MSVTHLNSRRGRIKRKPLRLPKLARIEMDGSSAGAWALEDHPDIFLFRHDCGSWEAWGSLDTQAREMLERHGLADELFPTRRSALQTLSAVLDLEAAPANPPARQRPSVFAEALAA